MEIKKKRVCVCERERERAKLLKRLLHHAFSSQTSVSFLTHSVHPHCQMLMLINSAETRLCASGYLFLLMSSSISGSAVLIKQMLTA